MIYQAMNRLLALFAICMGICSCAPVEKKELGDVRVESMGFDPASELPDFTVDLENHSSRIAVELKVLQDGGGDPQLRKRIIHELQTRGMFLDYKVMAPERVHRISSLEEADRLFQGQGFSQNAKLVKLIKKYPKTSVAFVHPDSILFLFFDPKDRFAAYVYP